MSGDIKRQKDKINELRQAKKIVLKNFDILLSDEGEELYYNTINALNQLINGEIETLEYLENKAKK